MASASRRRFVGAALGALTLAGGMGGGLPGVQADPPGDGRDEPRRFIVTLWDSVANPAAVAAEHAARLGGSVDFVYEHALKGFAITARGAGIGELARDGRVAGIEPDGEARAYGVVQNGATWGLDRIDQRNLPLSGTFAYNSTGAGVTAYIIDTGIRLSHQEFGGRASTGYDGITPAADDCNGHGTHVAGTVGGATYGVAKAVTLVAVRVLDCTGTGATSGVIAGIDWVTGNHLLLKTPAVANMSLGGSKSAALDSAVSRSIASGVSYAVAAGNGLLGLGLDLALLAQNACNSSPSGVPEAMTVSATNRTDAKAAWANYGSCVDWFAPGIDITSAWNTNDTATSTASGTSMSAPHTAGVAAQYLQGNTTATPAMVTAALYAATTKDKVTSARSANDHLLFSAF
jgi:subtilisin family serine protease